MRMRRPSPASPPSRAWARKPAHLIAIAMALSSLCLCWYHVMTSTPPPPPPPPSSSSSSAAGVAAAAGAAAVAVSPEVLMSMKAFVDTSKRKIGQMAADDETSLLRGSFLKRRSSIGGMSTVGTVVLQDELIMPPLPPGAPPYRKWAYAYLVAGCDPQNADKTYMGFLYNVLNAAFVLKDMPGKDVEPTKADIIVMIQMAQDTSDVRLPEKHERWLTTMGVTMHYLPKPTPQAPQSFVSIQMMKFRILNMTQYSRVMFLDGDVLPLTSLDYIFDMSEPEDGDDVEPLIKSNLVHTMFSSPSNGGMFMLEPKEGYYEELLAILHAQEEKGEFDPIQGWGHAFKPKYDDYWHNVDGKKHFEWDFHAASTDQGLLYHWTKYVRKDVSILNARTGEVEHFVRDDRSPVTVTMQAKNQPFLDRGYVSTIMNDSQSVGTPFPARNFYHATGTGKPWFDNPEHPRPIYLPSEFSDFYSRYAAWFGVLWSVAEKLEIDLDVPNLVLPP